MDDSLTITIETDGPIDLGEFIRALASIQSEYDSVTQSSSKLMVKEIRKGSFEIELISVMLMANVLPFINNVNSIVQFFHYMKDSSNWLLGKQEKPEDKKYSVKELRALKQIFQPVAGSNDQNSRLKIATKQNVPFVLTQLETRTISQSVDQKTRTVPDSVLDLIIQTHFTKVLFYWYQTGFDDDKINNGNKGIISAIDQKPRKIIFQDDDSETKYEMTTSNPALGAEWQNVTYVVDVELLVRDNSVLAYKILKNHMKDAIVEA